MAPVLQVVITVTVALTAIMVPATVMVMVMVMITVMAANTMVVNIEKKINMDEFVMRGTASDVPRFTCYSE